MKKLIGILLLASSPAFAQTGQVPPGGGSTPPATCTITQTTCTPPSPYGFPGTCTTTTMPCPVVPPPPCTKPDATGKLVPC